ncbi:hypothetical protein [Methylobacterium nonmethylotrophicum]|jgi:hypothetical protein|uniref:Uncharacterized protein n=2 Tax=Methylobacterium TaxID=407 RepID=A0AA37M5L3_9HYPH|nr:hypothetical protein [Methylobacterium nonmethylotrophicum]TGD97900.1 hypothetical protein EU555_17150 [Methylobacterium nonmethylotrophicum]GJD63430.1 hypothetical protein MPEAHAMD_3598 [Methylobacterium frigidaeris]
MPHSRPADADEPCNAVLRDRRGPLPTRPACHPLAAWRVLGPGAVDAATLDEIRRALAGPVLLHHRLWRKAVSGDAAAMVAVAVDVVHGRGSDEFAGDLAMSCLLVHARAGCDVAALVLAHNLAVLSRRGALDGNPADVGGR